MKRYERYKDSGIEWIGEIPEHWELKKFNQISYMKGRIGWQGLKQSEFTTNINEPFLITGMNFKDGKICWDEVYHISEERYNQAPEIQLKNNDVLITKDGTIGKLLYVENIPFPHKSSLNSHLLVLRPFNESYDSKYLYYQLQSYLFKNHIELTKTGTTFFGITQESVGQYKMLLPIINEQTAIANYLDRKAAEIDDLITQKEELLKLYEEEKTAIINKAVTKGINPDVKVKDSGIDWLGEIPEHWDVKKVKYVGKSIIGIIYSPSEIVTDPKQGILVLRASNIQEGKLSLLDNVYVNKEIEEELKTKVGDILICSRSGSATLIGKNILINERSTGNTFGAFMTIFRTKLFPFVYYYFNSQVFKGQTGLFQTVTINQLTINVLNNFIIAIPPPEEQTAIVNHIEKETTRINTKIEKTKKLIELLKEYRTALISEVVTGKIKVTE
ncbi:MAG: restriction endonuclease subunit S [bacterium]